MSADETKISAASEFDSIKNYSNPTAQTVTFSGSIAAGTEMTRVVNITLPLAIGAIGSFLFNYSGAPNDSSKWLFGPGPLRWGTLELDGGWADVPIKVFSDVSTTQATFTLTALNGDIADRNIVTPVVVLIRPALFIPPF